METELAKQRLIDFLFLMEVEMGWKQVWGIQGMGCWLLKGGSSNVNVGCVHVSGPPFLERSPPRSHGSGHWLPAPFEPLEAGILPLSSVSL